MPNYPAPDGVKLAAGWLVERAGFARGYPGDGGAGPAVDQARAGRDQSRRRHDGGRCWRWPETVRDGVRSAFGIELTPEPILVGCAL